MAKNFETVEIPSSSVLAEIGYDSERSQLYVKFKKGGVYRYSQVPLEIFSKVKELVNNGESVGKFFSSNIKGKFFAVKS